jgi:hypothetical protein
MNGGDERCEEARQHRRHVLDHALASTSQEATTTAPAAPHGSSHGYVANV